jgi:hypothetical protein
MNVVFMAVGKSLYTIFGRETMVLQRIYSNCRRVPRECIEDGES